MGTEDMGGSGEIVPGWQYRAAEPYTEGNSAAVTHGGYSPGRWKPRAAAIKAALLAAPGLEYLREERFALGVDDLCEAQAIGDALGDWLDSQGIEASAAEVIESSERIDEDGGRMVTRKTRGRRVQPVLDLRSRYMGRCQSLRRDLGITPASYAQITRDIGVAAKQVDDNLERLARIGQGIRERREAERAARSAET